MRENRPGNGQGPVPAAPALNPWDPSGIRFRRAVRPSDLSSVRQIVESTGFFRAAEIEIAVELVSERLSRGEASGYHFLFAQKSGRVLGYTCFGPIPGTLTGHDLYWIAVRSECRRQGVGSALLRLTERAVRRMGGRRLYADTSSQPLYEPTRAFYVRWGFIQEALLRDYYAPGDHKAIYVKVLAPDPPCGRRPWRR